MKDFLKIRDMNPLHEDIKVYAVRCRLSRGRKISGGELREFAGQLMSSIAVSCIKQGAKVIGHIKAYLEHDTGFLHAHTVGEPGDVTIEGTDGSPADRFTVVINSVVYGLAAEAVKGATESTLESLRIQFGFLREP